MCLFVAKVYTNKVYPQCLRVNRSQISYVGLFVTEVYTNEDERIHVYLCDK